ncbi:hypothetical protein FO519_000094 [Halicephalobus sp. NKZ332]|nr:hypothetical protein FO519_000094 [Halicephalobus sp. NKZ332]
MWGTQYPKLKTNLRLAANRLKLLQKKKTELAMKARTEIVDFVTSGKPDRARIRVESIIREDFLVEAYELLEMYCELLHTRFGVIQQMKEPDDGIAEAVISLLWVAPRIAHEVPEFKVISDQLTAKYGKPFAEAARMNQLTEPAKVAPKLIQKLSVNAPSKLLVEKYLIEICRCANVPFEADEKVMREDDDEIALAERNLNNFLSDSSGPTINTSDPIGWSMDNSIDGLPPINKGPGHGGSGGGIGIGMVANTAPPVNPTPPAYPVPTHVAPTIPPPCPAPIYPHPNCAAPHVTPPSFAPPQAPGNFYSDPHQRPPSTASAPEVDHIYEVPPGNFDFDFPEPPKDFPSKKGGGGGDPDPSDVIDDLARRFDELKKRT